MTSTVTFGRQDEVTIHTDDDLVSRVLAGRRQEYAEIVRRHEALLYAYLRSRVGSNADAEDLAQETFIEALLSLDRYRPNTNFPAWLRSIARNLARNHFRAQSRRRTVLLSEACLDLEDPLPPPEAHQAALRHCLDQLDDQAQGVVKRFYQDAESLRVIGEAIHQSVSWVGVTLHRARHSLRACMERGGVEWTV